MMVREVAPAGALGTVFAFVSTGFNVGQGLAPLAYGALLDRGLDNELLYLSAAFMVMSAPDPAEVKIRLLLPGKPTAPLIRWGR